MRWSEELTLITTAPPAEKTDANGFTNPDVETALTVFANKKSVGYSEFYKAAQAGYAVELKFDVHTEEYTGQTLAEFEGKRYKVLRTYVDPKMGDTIELTLSDMTERAGNAAAPDEGGAGGG